MRISRPCYDKYWRCPGWAGGGWKFPKVDTCPGGSLAKIIDYDGHWQWKFHQCRVCGVWVLPYYSKYLAPSYLLWEIKWKLRDIFVRWQ